MDIATMVFHPASDVSATFTDQYPTTERTLDNKLRNTDYSSNFILLYEVRMSRAEAYQVAPTILYDDLGWTGWRTVTAPMARASRDPSELDLSPETEDVIATTVVRYSAEATPRRVRLPVYDEETGALRSEMTVRAES